MTPNPKPKVTVLINQPLPLELLQKYAGTRPLPRPMNTAISCIGDTLRLLLEEAKQAKESAAAKRGSPEEAFEVGRSEALTEALHTWANQLQTFGLDAKLNGAWDQLRAFLSSEGY